MPTIPDAHKEMVQSHLPNGETIKAAHSDGLDTLIVTDSRLFSVTSGERGDQKARGSKAVSFDEVTSVTVDVLEDDSYHLGCGMAALVFAVFTFGLFGFSMNSSGGGAAGLALLGAIASLVGAIVATSIALDTDDGGIDVEIRTSNDDDTHTYKLPRDAEDVAASITAQAAC